MYRIIIFSTIVFVYTVNAQQGTCKQGECKSLNKCAPLLALVNKKDRTQEDIDTLRNAHCGFSDDNVPNVCCPPDPSSNKCYTPQGQEGTCISIYSCPALANLLKPPVAKNKIRHIQNSKCNGPEQYSVCCGPVPNLTEKVSSVCKLNTMDTIPAFPPDPSSGCCGKDASLGDKIYGGTVAAIDQYPWLVLIEYTNKDGSPNSSRALCGGSLISGRYVLTAAHCMVGQVLIGGRPSHIRLGEFDTSYEGMDCVDSNGGGQDCTEGITRIEIEKLIPHPQYNPGNSQNRNDIALIRMKESVSWTEFIRPICLPTVDLTLDTAPFNLSAAGWGAVSLGEISSQKKLHVELPYVPRDQCQPAYRAPGRNVTLWKGHLCAGGVKGKDSCKGDSGGPLMYQNDRIFELTGVVSFGPLPCGSENIPGVYTNVYEYNTWIRSNIEP